jgi:hypothetical protein
MKTEDLIRTLGANAAPVQRLPHPATRAVVWLVISTVYIAGFIWVMGLRPDIAVKLAEPRFLVEVGAAYMTSMMAAAAAFCAGCPGRPLWERFAPLPFLVLWLASLGEGCWRDWVRSGSDGLTLQPDLLCFPMILAISIVPTLLILIMIRRAAPVAPITTTALATLAAAALAATALRLFHAQDASLMVLVWQFGSVALLAGIAALFGQYLLPWPRPQIWRFGQPSRA